MLSYDLWNTLDAEIVLAFGSGAFCANALVHFEDFASFELIDGDGLLLTRKVAVLDVIRHKAGSSNCRCIEGKHGPSVPGVPAHVGGAWTRLASRPRSTSRRRPPQTADDALPFAVVGTPPPRTRQSGPILSRRRARPEATSISSSLHERGRLGAPHRRTSTGGVAALCVSGPRPSRSLTPRGLVL